jgi:hypothetical protein
MHLRLHLDRPGRRRSWRPTGSRERQEPADVAADAHLGCRSGRSAVAAEFRQTPRNLLVRWELIGARCFVLCRQTCRPISILLLG